MHKTQTEQLTFPTFGPPSKNGGNGHRASNNKLQKTDKAYHEWYRFVLSYPPHLVRTYISEFGLSKNSLLLDPFCGTGTTLVEAKLNGIPSVGVEVNPFAQFASAIKTDWNVDPILLRSTAHSIAKEANALLLSQGINDNESGLISGHHPKLATIEEEARRLLLTDSISPLPLHKTLVLLEALQQKKEEREYPHLLLALAKALVFRISNLRFGPEVGLGKIQEDAPVLRHWLETVEEMVTDLENRPEGRHPFAEAFLGDSREIRSLLPGKQFDAVITSPPYPNEKEYTRTTRMELVLLGFISSKQDLQALKRKFVRSNTRGVYKNDTDELAVHDNERIRALANEIENRRIALGKTSGFEKLYGKVTTHYFGGMKRHLADLQPLLKRGAMLAYVVGDQASYFRVHIHTGEILTDLAKELGYEHVRTDLFRNRFATASKKQLREEIVILRNP